MKQNGYILHIESMRAIAAMFVLLFHFIQFRGDAGFLIGSEAVRSWSEFGAQGVEMFYIISGYVMTLSLSRKNYRLVHFGSYLWKRMLRIIPLYWSVIACLIVIGLIWKNPLDITSIVANLFFIVDAVDGASWMNPVFATLGVEVQFYLLLGLFFPLLRSHIVVKYTLLAVWLLLGYFTIDQYTVLSCAPFFITGMLLHDFQERIETLGVVLLVMVVAALFWLKLYQDLAIIGLTCSLFLWIKPTWKPLQKLGEASYSLYLTHGIFGGWLLFFATATAYGNTTSPWLILAAIVASILGAFVFYWAVEKPSTRWSKSFKIK